MRMRNTEIPLNNTLNAQLTKVMRRKLRVAFNGGSSKALIFLFSSPLFFSAGNKMMQHTGTECCRSLGA